MLKNKPEILTLREAAEILQVSMMTLRRWDNKGILKAFRPSKSQARRYHKKDVLALLKKSPVN